MTLMSFLSRWNMPLILWSLFFGATQEMTVFVTELSINIYTLRFIEEFGCEKFYRYNKILLVDGETL